MIGDCLDADVGGALNFGIDAIFFNPYNIEVQNSIKQVKHLLEIKKHL
jgi:putative hydrolase of the HAD superfamily